MTLKHIEEYRDSEIAKSLITKIKTTSRRSIRLMEVCGTHTVSIFRSGIRSVLPDTIADYRNFEVTTWFVINLDVTIADIDSTTAIIFFLD